MPPAASVRNELFELDPIVYFMMGGMLVFMGLFVVLAAPVSFLVNLCLAGGVFPGSLLILYGVVVWRKDRILDDFAAFVTNYRRIRVDDLATKIGKTRFETERLLAKATDREFLKGYIDRATDEFVVQTPAKDQVYVGECPNCGGRVDRWAFVDEVMQCPYCEAGVPLPTPTSKRP